MYVLNLEVLLQGVLHDILVRVEVIQILLKNGLLKIQKCLMNKQEIWLVHYDLFE
jgi:hypothetical protein